MTHATTGTGTTLYHALVRTHHITSKKKIAGLRKAAARHACFVLLHSGKPPGIMYCRSDKLESVASWVGVVKSLRYKDFRLTAAPSPAEGSADESRDSTDAPSKASLLQQQGSLSPGLHEVDSVKAFAAKMEEMEVLEWWRSKMGFSQW